MTVWYKMESPEYNLFLALTWAIRSTSKEKILSRIGIGVSFDIKVGVGNFAFFMKSWKMRILSISSAWVIFWQKLCFLEICHLVQVIAPRFLMLQLILSYQLKDLIFSFFKHCKLYLLTIYKHTIWRTWIFVFHVTDFSSFF